MTYSLHLTNKIAINARALVLCFVCLLSLGLNAQTWERFYNFSEFDFLKSALPTEDGGILYIGQTLTITGVPSSESSVMMVKTDRDGNLEWDRIYTEDNYEEIFQVIPTSDGNYLLGGLTYISPAVNFQGWILKMDSEGNILWSRKYGGPGFDKIYALHETADGGFVFAGATRSEIGGDIMEPPVDTAGMDDSWIGKIDADGDLLWNHRFGSETSDFLVDIALAPNGDIFAVGNYLPPGLMVSWEISLYRYDQDGNSIGDKLIYGGSGYEEAFSIINTSDGNFAIGAITNSQGSGSADTYLLQVDPDGGILDEDTYGGTNGEFAAFVQEMSDGGFSILSSTTSFGSPFLDLYLIRTEANGDTLWTKVFNGGNDRYDVPYPFTIDEDDYYYIIANQQEKNMAGDTIFSAQTYILKADALGNTVTNALRGKVAIDENNNCIPENGEQGLEDWLVVARDGDQTYYSTTDTNGDYFIELETGTYSVEVISPGDYWEACDNIAFITIDSPYDTTVYNFNFNDGFIVCEEMEVDLSTPFIDYCDENIYNIVYRNTGTDISDGAVVEIILPSSFSFISSTVPLSGQNDSLYTFNIPEVPVNEIGRFEITVEHDCTNQVPGRTHEMQARIGPDEICLPQDPIWDESSIELRAEIVGENVQFYVTNVGDGDMGEAVTGVIIEDWVLPRTEPIQLNSQETDTIIVVPEGRTARLEVAQSAGHPGRSNPSITVEGVGMNMSGGISTGYVNHYPEDDANRFKSIDAQISENYLPNVLRAYPRGYGSDRFIAPNGDIEYHLWFQHTGNDTLPWLYLEDQLPPELNVETLRPGASSHPYDYEVVGDGVVRFNFNDINLVGDEINEAASFGFVKFRVSQQPNLPDGTSFSNKIRIQKPNDRVITNGVWHEIKYGHLYGAYVATHCTGDTVFGQVVTADIVLRDTMVRESQDSITTAKIFVLENEFTEELIELQPGELYNEVLYLEDTTLVKFYPASNGCDSIVTTTLDILTRTTSLEQPFQFSLYPNPGYKQVTMSYRLPASSGIQIRLYQATGMVYRTIEKGIQAAGLHRMTLPTDLPTGIYWVALQTDDGTIIKKLVIQ